MTPKLPDGPKGPLFAKIAFIYFVTSFALLATIGGFFFFQRPTLAHGRERFQRNTAYMTESLLKSIGNPPDAARTAELAKSLDCEIEYEGPKANFSSVAGLPSIDELESDSLPGPAPFAVRSGHHKENSDWGIRSENSFFILSEEGPYRFAFLYPGAAVFNTPWSRLLTLLGLILLILLFSYVTVRWLLSPMPTLLSGVSEIGAGNLDTQITLPAGHAEFQALADGLNHMSGRIREMIHSKERLLIDVSHELRSPLARMKLALELLPRSANQRSLARAASEMEIMLSELLESERLKSTHGALHKSELDLPALALQIARSYRQQTPGAKLIKPKEFPPLMVDEDKVATVLKNVIENSLKYSQGQKKAVEIRFESSAAEAKVKIKDYGIGIPEEDLKQVFEPFYRVDKSRSKASGGYGLGLSLCREIMRAHGGQIDIRSALGSGTEVSLSFPR